MRDKELGDTPRRAVEYRPHAEGVPPNSLNRYSSKSKKPRVCIISIACLR